MHTPLPNIKAYNTKQKEYISKNDFSYILFGPDNISDCVYVVLMLLLSEGSPGTVCRFGWMDRWLYPFIGQ